MQSETMSSSTAGLLPALKDVLRPAYYFVNRCRARAHRRRGLSPSIIGNALRNRGDGELHTCDISTVDSRTAQQCLKWHPARPFIHFHTGDAPAFLDRMIAQRRTFGLVFVDHWHSYEQTHEVAIRLPRWCVRAALPSFTTTTIRPRAIPHTRTRSSRQCTTGSTRTCFNRAAWWRAARSFNGGLETLCNGLTC